MKTDLFPVIKFFKKTNSTNELARQFLENSIYQKNFVVCTREQTAGQGRMERSWYSPVGGLYFTLAFPDQHFPSSVTLFTGVVIHKVLSSTFPDLHFSIKWPNDILVSGKKVGGILTSSNKSGTIVGMGIDCNVERIPERLKGIATSLLIETNKKVALKRLLKVILKTFEENLQFFNEFGFIHFVEYFEKFHSLANKKVVIHSGDTQLVGKVMGITDEGALNLENENGLHTILSADKIDILN
ncbi:MAG TPA: biotin--[acetyl-CoA-carboxylase] ligase [Candidatus Cloacimonetes bacterium]|nr:biotin--[acetyl-CoA-carboxylase] ligase [Candidatus Cloacimonadota bacterium]